MNVWNILQNTAKDRTLAAPSILSGDFGYLSDSAKKAEQAGADLIHVDVMDGSFVPNITFGPDVVAALKKAVNIPLDVHLMISRPDKYAAKFIEAGADILTVHKESDHDVKKTLMEIKEMNAVPGVVINPDTEVNTVEDVLQYCSIVLVMSVFPGFGGQKFIIDVIKKIELLVNLRKKNNYNYLIEIDGGINEETSKKAIIAGADMLVAGTYVFKNQDLKIPIDSLKTPKINTTYA
ncbi:MAG: ribulose-phosphate 3-epimerase [Candidatus Aureabacteria bacterium]|nr:ribulose-phosphate 3-epimerase [Candidatus Auribacterota bacterium]